MGRKHNKPAMEPAPDAPAGMERDSKGRAIAMKQRTPDDQLKARRARAGSKKKSAKKPLMSKELRKTKKKK